MTHEDLARDLGRASKRSTVAKAIAELEQRGYLKVSRGCGRTHPNYYRFDDEVWFDRDHRLSSGSAMLGHKESKTVPSRPLGLETFAEQMVGRLFAERGG